MKTIVRTALAVLVGVSVCGAQTTSSVEEILPAVLVEASAQVASEDVVVEETDNFIQEVSVSFDVHSAYIDPDVGAPVYDGAVMHSTLSVQLPNSWYMELFVSSGFNTTFQDDDFSDEIDITLGRSWEVGGCTIDVAVAWCDSQQLLASKNDLLWSRAFVSFPDVKLGTATITPYAHVTGLWTPRISETSSGLVTGAGLQGTIPLVCTGAIRMMFDCMVAYDTGAYSYKAGCICKVFAGFEFDVTPSFTLRAGTTFWQPLNNQRAGEYVGSIGFVHTF